MTKNAQLEAETQSLLIEAEKLAASTRRQVDLLRDSRHNAARKWERFKHILKGSPSLAARSERK
ncbi:MAG TPA: hypothetical protein VEA77_01110 [Hyphomicrobium sp.]|nr:hypothetical protein [Hyphomicrobium sp.]